MKTKARIIFSVLGVALLFIIGLVTVVVIPTSLASQESQSVSYEVARERQIEANPVVIRDPATLTLLMDEANLLTENYASQLREKLVRLSNKNQADIVIVTVNSLSGMSPMEFADDYFDYNGYGQGPNHDGLLLLISMEDRDWWVSTTGSAIYAFTDAGIDFIGEQMLSNGLSTGDYASAFDTFANLADRFFKQAAKGAPFDLGHMPKVPGDLTLWTFMGLVGGLFIALFATGRMKKQLISVKMQKLAADYILPGSFRLSYSNDQFLRKNLSQTVREVATSSSSGGGGGSSTHSGSSGSSHGGGGGKF